MLDSVVQDSLSRSGVRSGRLLVAVSGGRDSMVLLDLLRGIAEDRRLELVVAHVNHRLRGEESELDEAHVRDAASKAGLECAIRNVSPADEQLGRSSRARPTLEEASRDVRRRALLAIAEETGCQWIATAHHAGDQAETVLMRLLRGTGPDGLAAMAERSADGYWLKPLLAGMPEEIHAWATAQAVAWREDASNQDRRFMRNQLRHDWIPGLAETFNPQLLRSLVHLAEAQRRDLEWIEAQVSEAARERIKIEPSGIRLAIDGWDGIPEALARRLVRFALIEAGIAREITRTHLERALAFVRRGRSIGRDKRLQLPKGIVLRRDGDVFLLALESDAARVEEHDNATVPRRD